MIEAFNVSKKFDDIQAVDSISLCIKEGSVFGLIGTNGAGKSTFMHILSGVLKPDSGSIKIDDEDVFENINAKSKLFFIADDVFYFNNSTPFDMMKYFSVIYPKFDKERFVDFLEKFELNGKRKINTFSKGMKKQLSILCGICSNTEYLLCDETFDGLDPVMRQAVKSIFASEMTERKFTPIIASHNLRELEDICDFVGLLHKGGVILSKDLEEMKTNIHKVQCVFDSLERERIAFKDINVIKSERRGSLLTVTARGDVDEIVKNISMQQPIFLEALPLSLEEIFISETEVIGYDIKKLIF